jgi:hypothetical protein
MQVDENRRTTLIKPLDETVEAILAGDCDGFILIRKVRDSVRLNVQNISSFEAKGMCDFAGAMLMTDSMRRATS